jgi:hypothetical protein
VSKIKINSKVEKDIHFYTKNRHECSILDTLSFVSEFPLASSSVEIIGKGGTKIEALENLERILNLIIMDLKDALLLELPRVKFNEKLNNEENKS